MSHESRRNAAKEKVYTLFGFLGLLAVYLSIGISILFSPWFSWQRNALSDLGHAVKSGVAPIFNLGLLFGGFLIIIYVLMVFRERPVSSAILVASISMANRLTICLNLASEIFERFYTC